MVGPSAGAEHCPEEHVCEMPRARRSAGTCRRPRHGEQRRAPRRRRPGQAGHDERRRVDQAQPSRDRAVATDAGGKPPAMTGAAEPVHRTSAGGPDAPAVERKIAGPARGGRAARDGDERRRSDSDATSISTPEWARPPRAAVCSAGSGTGSGQALARPGPGRHPRRRAPGGGRTARRRRAAASRPAASTRRPRRGERGKEGRRRLIRGRPPVWVRCRGASARRSTIGHRLSSPRSASTRWTIVALASAVRTRQLPLGGEREAADWAPR